MKYGLNLSWNQILEDSQTLAMVREYLPALEIMVQKYPRMKELSLRALSKYVKEYCPEEQVRELETCLVAYGKTKGLTAEETKKVAFYREMFSHEKKTNAIKEKTQKYKSFHPGQPWYDTNGNRIQAHGGAVFYEAGNYYWYGENKEYTDGENPIWTWGIRVYKSTDLYNWEDLGYIVKPDVENPDSNLFPEKYIDRPHIIKCEKTGRYVMWIKVSGVESCFVILQANEFMGPYEVVVEDYYPLGNSAGDFDIVVDSETKNAYLYQSADHTNLYTYLLSEDYLSVDRKIASHYTNLMPPFCREGIAMCQNGEKKYMVTSGMTGYTPNQSDYAVALNWEDEFVSQGDPHVNDESMSSFNSQISKIFKVEGKENLYIAMADRWMPNDLLDYKQAEAIRRVVASKYQPDMYSATEEEKKMFAARPDLERANTSIADYVWLPILFENEKMHIAWQDEWRIEDYL